MPTPPAIRRNRTIAALLALAVVLGPLWVVRQDTDAMSYYLGGGFPPGQSTYVMMRYTGHIAFALVFLQIVLGLQHRRLGRWLGAPTLLPLHRSLGLSAFCLALLHPVLFEWARILRTNHTTVTKTFFPDPRIGYYEQHQLYGAIGLYALAVGVAAGLVGPRLAPRWWRWVHGVNLVVFFLVWWHSFTIGSDTRVGYLPALYTAMLLTVAALWAERVWRGRPGRLAVGRGATEDAGA